LNGLDRVFGRESAHNQSQGTVGCHLNGSPINPLDVFSGASAGTVHSYNEFDIFHDFSSLEMTNQWEAGLKSPPIFSPLGTDSQTAVYAALP
jgi:hypothetical protein